jgi:hypothetical protein
VQQQNGSAPGEKAPTATNCDASTCDALSPPAETPTPDTAAPPAAAAANEPTPEPAGQASSPTQPPTQQTSPQPSPAVQPSPTAEGKNEAYERQTGTSRDRLGFLLPNFLSIDDIGKVPPLTWEQKFKVQTRSTFDWTKIPWYNFLAGISEASHKSDSEFGTGGVGYARRLGSITADSVIENYWTSAILPSVLHQDPRFYVQEHGSWFHRVLYPLRNVVVTQSDSGRTEFNASEVFGSGIAASISTYSYHPRSERTVGDVGQVWRDQVLEDVVSFELKEFWPDLRRRLRKGKDNKENKDTS